MSATLLDGWLNIRSKMSNNKISFEDTSIAFSYKTDSELKKSFLLFASINNRLLVKLGTNMVKLALKMKAPVKGIIRKSLFHQFCGGESIENCRKTIELLSQYRVGAILDYAVEGKDTEEDYDGTAAEILRTIDLAKNNAAIPFCVFKPSGIASVEILRKIHEENPLTAGEKLSFEKIRQRFFRLGERAFKNNVKILIDSEESWIQRPVDEIAEEMMGKFNLETAIIFNTYQMYRKGMLEELHAAVKRADKKFVVGAKLVRGAYMEKERQRAEEKGYADPIMPDKAATDRQFNEALCFCIENVEDVYFCSGSHNENSNLYLTQLMAENGLKNDDSRVYFAQLFGMSDNISFNLANAGYNVAKYLPYGPIEAVMPYLFRRAEENTAIAGQSSRELKLVKKELKRRKIRR